MADRTQTFTPTDAQTLSDPVSMAAAVQDRATLDMVRQAVAGRRVALAFQPIVQTERPDRPAYYEGLVRILDETGRPIPAADFIGAIETTETGRIIDCLALEMGLAALAEEPSLRLAVNMSARSIGYQPWMQALERGTAHAPHIAERLILEITESSAMLVPELVTMFMADLQRRGIAFALDDFGAGYTAFRYLRDFHFDILKIDRQFIDGIHDSPDDQVLTAALISIARQFEMFTVAEGVESAEDAAYLAETGIDCMQGYYFGVPTLRPYWRERNRRAG